MNQLVDYLDHVVMKLRSTMRFSAPPTEDEMLQFARGVFLHIKALAASAPVDARDIIREHFLHIWDFRTDDATTDFIQPKCLRDSIDKLKLALAHHQVLNIPTPLRVAIPDPSCKSLPTTLEDAVQDLWLVESTSRLRSGTGFRLQEQSHARSGGDRAANKLFSFVDAAFFRRPTVRAFVALLDNYDRAVGHRENFTEKDNVEMKKFLDEVLKTPQMGFLHSFLKSKKLCGPSPSDLHHLLFDLWFAPYRRKQRDDSSGFERVFVGEEAHGAITSFHNWIQFYLEEQRGLAHDVRVNDERSELETDCAPVLISCAFPWTDDDPEVENEDPEMGMKSESSFLLGTTPEFELALLTLCFLCGEEGRNWITMGTQELYVRCHRVNTRFGAKVGSAFVEV